MDYKKIGERTMAILCMLFLPLVAWAQKQYYLPTAGTSDDEKDKPMIEVYLPQQPNGCAVVLCPGGAMRWLSWESDVVKMASFLNEHGIAAIGLRYHLNKTPMPQGMKMPPMVDVTHPEAFPQADANPMHTTSGDSIIQLAAQDAKAAIRMVREHADEWHISKDKIGYLGFSAGGRCGHRCHDVCRQHGASRLPLYELWSLADASHRSAGCTSPAHYDSCRPSQCGCRTYCPVHGVEEVWGEC